MGRPLWATTSGVALLAGIVSGLPGTASAQSTPEAQLEEVLVTASRRETTLQSIPQSIAVLNGEAQRERGQQRLEDLQVSVPNVSFTSTSNSSQLYIRGIGNTFINAGGDPGVAFYQDGAYVSDQRTLNTSMFDVQRVEILRGPQGALYGRNAVGGAINVISARPTETPEGRIDVAAGDYGRFETEGYLSGPIGAEPVSARISFQTRKLEGYTRNLLAGQSGAPDRFDDIDTYGARGQVATDLPGEGRLTLLGSWYREDDTGPALGVVNVPGIVYPAEAITGQRPTNLPRSIKANVGSSKLEVATANLSFVQPIRSNTLNVTLNYRDGLQDSLNDCDGVEADTCQYLTHTASQDYFAEAYIYSPADRPLRWTAGASYIFLNQAQKIQVPWQSLLSYIVPGAPSNAPFFIDYDAGGDLDIKSFAVFADVRYQLSDIWSVAGQVRYTETVKKANEYQFIPQFGSNVSSFPNRLKNTHTPFKLSVEAQFTPDILAYASYATANKDGAINVGVLQATPVKPEEVQTIELGAKSSFFERRVQVNAAIYRSEYDNLQINQVRQIITLSNVPKSTIKGAELDISAVPTDGLRLSAGVGYLDGTFDRFINGRTIPGAVPGPPEDLSGNQLSNVAKWSVNLDAQYSFAVLSGYRATLGAQYAWRSRVYFDEFNDLSNSQAKGGILNLRASIAPTNGPWRLYGYVTNVFDRTYQYGSTIYSGLLGAEKAVGYSPPRHFAVGVSYAF